MVLNTTIDMLERNVIIANMTRLLLHSTVLLGLQFGVEAATKMWQCVYCNIVFNLCKPFRVVQEWTAIELYMNGQSYKLKL